MPGAISGVSVHCGQACGTLAYGINSSEKIVGWYEDRAVVPHGFLRDRNGSFLTIDTPGAALNVYEGTVACRIDDAGVVTGEFEDASTMYQGYVREPDGTFEESSAPGAGRKSGLGTFAWTIDRHGDTAGMYYDKSRTSRLRANVRSSHSDLRPARLVDAFACFETCVRTLGPSAPIVTRMPSNTGSCASRMGRFSYSMVREPDKARIKARIQTVNSTGTIAGTITDSNDIVRGFIRYTNGSYRIGELPGAGRAPMKVRFRKPSMRPTR